MNNLISLNNYRNLLFDCDGVILDSNKIKERNIKKVAKKYMQDDILIPFLHYFTSNSGIPRELKIKKYLNDRGLIKNLLDDYHYLNLRSLKKAKIVDGFVPFIKNAHKHHENKFVISGGDQAELTEVLQFKNLTKYFKKILGGPKTKEENIGNLQLSGDTIYFGDSEIDFQICRQNNFAFVFVTGYTNSRLDFNSKYKGEIYQISNFNEIEYRKK